jgi:methionyl-tRNA synthetase
MDKNIFNEILNQYTINAESEVSRLAVRNKEELSAKLNADERELLEKLTEAHEELHYEVSRQNFKQGFRTCMTIMFEAFN